ncbi:hypothetical protein NPIL_644811 [Nephila pilipes]|uniref:Uncharacterized protein n=1 Tax=Nephila pilipes TaxID=299642 RepID=A0A8X6NAA2_NEPPI|nr:hypothetical protein NPIL_644811 [Nephila pilipes]
MDLKEVNELIYANGIISMFQLPANGTILNEIVGKKNGDGVNYKKKKGVVTLLIPSRKVMWIRICFELLRFVKGTCHSVSNERPSVFIGRVVCSKALHYGQPRFRNQGLSRRI